MYYKVTPNTPAFRALTDFQSKREKARLATRKLLKRFGTTTCIRPANSISGGVDGIELKECPEGWKPVHRNVAPNCFLPKATKQNKELLAEIKALPTVTKDDLNKALQFKPQFVENVWCYKPGLIIGKNFFSNRNT